LEVQHVCRIKVCITCLPLRSRCTLCFSPSTIAASPVHHRSMSRIELPTCVFPSRAICILSCTWFYVGPKSTYIFLTTGCVGFRGHQ
jgi:hypothetical protein